MSISRIGITLVGGPLLISATAASTVAQARVCQASHSASAASNQGVLRSVGSSSREARPARLSAFHCARASSWIATARRSAQGSRAMGSSGAGLSQLSPGSTSAASTASPATTATSSSKRAAKSPASVSSAALSSRARCASSRRESWRRRVPTCSPRNHTASSTPSSARVPSASSATPRASTSAARHPASNARSRRRAT